MKKLLKLFLLIYAVTHPVCTKSPESIAISQIVRDFYVKNSDRFDFMIFGSETRKLKDFVDDVLKVTSDVSPYELIEVKNEEKRVGVKQSAILLFDNWKAYEEFHARVRLTNESPRKFNFLVYIDDWKPTQSIQHTKQPLMLSRESFIHKSSDGSINLLTYSKFQQPNCKQWNLSNVNKFSQAEVKWEKQEFFIEKFKNFNGCEISATTPIPTGKCHFDENHKINEGCNRLEIILNEEIGRHLNFTSRYEALTEAESFDDMSEKLLRNDHAVTILQLRVLKQKSESGSLLNFLSEQFIATHPFTTSDMFILISRDVPYTQFEKLFLPFEIEVWIWLIAAMTTGVLTILIVKLAPREVQNFVFGDGISTPLLNFVIVIYGLGMIRLPRRGFARFLLMCFILFCLIFRTAYQSKQFEFLTKEMRRPDVKTISDLIEQNFTFYAADSTNHMVRELEQFTRINFKILNRDDITVKYGHHFILHRRKMRKYLKRLLSDGSKTAVVLSSVTFRRLFNEAEGQIELTRLEETIITDQTVFLLPRKSFMAEPFNRKLLQLIEAGISEKIVKSFEKKFYVEEPDEHIVLTLDHLGFGFYIWLGCLGIASTVFLLQIIYYKSLPTVASFVLRHFYP